MVKFASPSCVCFISFGFLLATTCVWVWMVCSLHSVTTGSRDRANVQLIIIVYFLCVPASEFGAMGSTSFLGLSYPNLLLVFLNLYHILLAASVGTLSGSFFYFIVIFLCHILG